MNDYGLAVDLEVLQQLLQAEESQREQVIGLLTRLRRQPFMKGDFQEDDDAGRTNEVVLVGEALVYFWSDHVDKTVRVAKLDFIEGD